MTINITPYRNNDGFSKVEDTVFTPSALAAVVPAVVKPSAVPANGVLIVAPTTADVALTPAMLMQLQQDGLLLWRGDGMSANRSVLLGADTNTNAADLAAYLGLDEASPRLLHFKQISPPSANFSLSLANSSGSSTWVQVSYNGDTPSDSKTLALSLAVSDAYVLVSKTRTNDTNFNEGAILFNIVCQAVT